MEKQIKIKKKENRKYVLLSEITVCILVCCTTIWVVIQIIHVFHLGSGYYG